MAKVSTETIRSGHRNEYSIAVNITINVTSDGMFNTTLSEQDAKLLSTFNKDLPRHPRSRKPGYFQAKTKSDLMGIVKTYLDSCMSREVKDERIVLMYSLKTVGSFSLTIDKKIIPNPGWYQDGEPDKEVYWQQGTHMNHATDPMPTGVQMYIQAFRKTVYEYQDGKDVVIYDAFTPFGGSNVKNESQYYLKWIEQICSTKPPSGATVHEIDYTEERAKFFVELFKSLCQLSHTIAQFEKPEAMVKAIESGKFLMQSAEDGSSRV